MRDTENTMLLNANDHTGNRFLGHWNKLLNMEQNLDWENQEKYLDPMRVRFNARLQNESLPICFGKCIPDVTAPGGLTPDEKNCMRECYFKRVNSKLDMSMHFQQKLANDNIRGIKDNYV